MWKLDAGAVVQPHWGSSGLVTKEAGSGWRVEASTYKHSRPTGVTSCASILRFFCFFSSTPTEESGLFNIMKPQQEPAGLCSSIWRRRQWLQEHTLDPSNWLWQQREMDKWETPPEWPDDWNEETCSESQRSVEKSSFVFLCLGSLFITALLLL